MAWWVASVLLGFLLFFLFSDIFPCLSHCTLHPNGEHDSDAIYIVRFVSSFVFVRAFPGNTPADSRIAVNQQQSYEKEMNNGITIRIPKSRRIGLRCFLFYFKPSWSHDMTTGF